MRFATAPQLWLFLAVVPLYACNRANEDPGRRAIVVDSIVHHSDERCLTGPTNGERPAYEARLRAVLDAVDLETLEVMKDLEVVVCLDQRVGAQDTLWWSPEVAGVYYDTGDTRVISLRDDGAAPGSAWFFERDATSWGPPVLGELANGFDTGAIPRQGTLFGGWYTQQHSPESAGLPVFVWSSPSGFWAGVVARNPTLLDPPLVANASRQIRQVDLDPRVSGRGDGEESPR